jgi:hypothetical protein
MNTTPQEERVRAVTALWKDLLPFALPETYRLNLWVMSHSVEVVLYAVKEMSLKRIKGNNEMTREQAIRLVGAICASVAGAEKHLAAAK